MARRFGVTPSAISQSVKKLEAQGYIERVRCDDDSRSVALVLTEKGRMLAHRARCAREAFMAELFDYVGAERMVQLIDALESIMEFCEKERPRVGCDGDEGEGPCA